MIDETDGIARVIRTLQIPVDTLEEYTDADREYTFTLDSMVRVFIYMHARDEDQQDLAVRLDKWPYLQSHFGLCRAPSQPTISVTKRNRFKRELRQFLEAVGVGLRHVAEEADGHIAGVAEPPTFAEAPDPDDDEQEPIAHFVDREASDLLETASELVFPVFDTGRASNVKHEDETIWESQTRMSLLGKRVGSRTVYRTFNREREDALHHDTHIRSIKMCATPGQYQYTFDDYDSDGGGPKPNYRRVAEELQNPFDEAIDNLLDELVETEMITQPVVAAIDITHDPYHVYPWKKQGTEDPDDELIEHRGKMKAPKEDYPVMVSGDEDEHEYGYTYATLTVINRDVPIVLAVEPLRENSIWEGDDGETTPKADAVDRLMERATDHLDIHLVMADRGFDVHDVYGVLESHDVNYLIPKRKYEEDWENIDKIHEHPTADSAVQHDVGMYPDKGEDHSVELLYVPAETEHMKATEGLDTDQSLAVFATNRDHVTPDDAIGLTNRYSNRWDIENEYRTILRFIPSVASKDYRVRHLCFLWAVLLYNVWRMVDSKLQILVGEAYDEYDANPADGRPDTLITAVGCVHSFLNKLGPPD